MRLKLTLKPKNHPCIIPINYQYQLSAVIYKILKTSSPDYADFLHQRGYASSTGKPMKLFTFSRLWCPDIQQVQNTLQIKGKTTCTLYVSSPKLEDFVQHFVIGLFQHQEIEISGSNEIGRFVITQVETMAEPEFRSATKFSCLSAIVVSGMHEHKGKKTSYYFRPDDTELNEAIRKNLIHKYQIIYDSLPKDDRLIFSFNEDYIQRKGGYDKISKLITIKEGEEEETRIKCFIAPFTLKGNIELIRMAYDCGIGEKNSLGFGMIEAVG